MSGSKSSNPCNASARSGKQYPTRSEDVVYVNLFAGRVNTIEFLQQSDHHRIGDVLGRGNMMIDMLHKVLCHSTLEGAARVSTEIEAIVGGFPLRFAAQRRIAI